MIVWPCLAALGASGGVIIVASLAIPSSTLIDSPGFAFGAVCALVLWPSVPGVVATRIAMRHTLPFDRTLVTISLWFVGCICYAILLGLGVLAIKVLQ
jgi:hypothetical protein